MKRLITLLVLVCLSSVLFAQRGTYENPVKVLKDLKSEHKTASFAQQNETNDEIKLLKPNYTRGKIWVNDSILSYKANGADWELTEDFKVLLRDDYGNMTNGITGFYNPFTDMWSKKDTITATYNGPGMNLKYMKKPWNSNTQQWADTSYYNENNENGQWMINLSRYWDPVQNKFLSGNKAYMTLDDEGHYLSKTVYTWGVNHQQWFPDKKQTYTYDDAGNKIRELGQIWSYETEAWADYSQNVFSYDENGNLEQLLTQNWISGIQEWRNNSLSLYTRDGNGKITERLVRKWNSQTEEWVNDKRYLYSYDDSGNLLNRISQNWNIGTEEWDNDRQWLMSNYEQGIPKQTVYQNWDKGTGEWQNDLQFFIELDESGNYTQQLQQNWNTEAGEWENTAQWFSDYDEQGNITQDLFQTWNNQEGSWENVFRTDYFWSEFETSGISDMNTKLVRIYPNPVTDKITIENAAAASGLMNVSILTVRGRLIKTAALNGQKSIIDLSGLSKGSYILHVETDKGTYTTKIIKL
ncbi:MAG: T9SS type A sorting domain-containing protein [Chlorobi bacterium]|nr:T9SS type A sorting domain-containing protein [Chlorobiota bacterium]